MKISQVMTTNVATVTPDQSAREAAAFMLSAEAGSIPVMEGDRLIGMITDRDIAVRGVAQGHGPETPVRELMSEGLICVRDDEEVADVASRMANAQVRRLPVVDSDDKLCGIVSLGDLSRESKPQLASEALEGVSQPGGDHRQSAL
ncbi:MAG TPA: CBS domain-containing protein [Sphingomicrobium sp.]